MGRHALLATLVAVAAIPAGTAEAASILNVGPTRELKTPSAAAKIALDGSIVEIDAAEYVDDVAVWTQSGLTLRGVGGLARLRSETRTAQEKAIWVIQGNATRVENVEFSGARVPDRNGAGIRQEGAGLTLVGCRFHDNENGVLSGKNPDSDILIERSEFSHNGYGDGFSHNMYIGEVRSFTLRHSYVHHAKSGHNVKSRALTNSILYNRIMDEGTGNSSYAIDLPNGGEAWVVGNLIQQGRHAENGTMINYASRSGANPGTLRIASNTLVNERGGGVFVHNRRSEPCIVVNNIFDGHGLVLSGSGEVSGNLFVRAMMAARSPANRTADRAGFVDPAVYDYRLTPHSPAVDAGIVPDPGGDTLIPSSEYVHPAGGRPRPTKAPLDIGAYELASAQ